MQNIESHVTETDDLLPVFPTPPSNEMTENENGPEKSKTLTEVLSCTHEQHREHAKEVVEVAKTCKHHTCKH